MKKLLLIVFIPISAVISALILIPILYDVNTKVKPLIVRAIEKNGRAQAEVGRLSLNLWGKVQIGIDGIKIIEKKTGDTVFSVRDAELTIPFMSLLTGQVEVSFEARKPSIFIAKDKSRSLNVMRLVESKSAPTETLPTQTTGNSAADLILSRLNLSIFIEEAKFTYADRIQNSTTEFDQLNFKLLKFRFGEPFEATLSTDANYHATGVDFNGPISLTSRITIPDDTLSEAQIRLTLDMTKTNARYTNLLKKDAGVPFRVESTLEYQKPQLDITEVKLWADDLNILVEGYLRHEPEMLADVSIKTEKLDLSKLHNVIGSLKDYNVGGLVSFDFKAAGPLDAMRYAGFLNLSGISGQKGSSDFKLSGAIADLSQPHFKGQVSARQIEVSDFSEYKNVRLKNLSSQISYFKSELNVKGTSFDVFGGKVGVDLVANTSAKPMSYNVKLKTTGVDVNDAIASQMPEYKDSLKGRLESQWAINGTAGTTPQIQKSLRGSGQFNLQDGSWSGLAAVKMMAEKLKSIPRIQEKAKELKVGDSFKVFKSNVEIKDMKLFLNQLVMELKDSKTSLIGNAKVDFDKNFELKGFVLAPIQNPPKSLRADDGRAKLPIEMFGKVNGPEIKWNATTSVVANAYLQDEGAKAIEGELKKLKENVKDENLKKVLDKVPDNVGDLLKGIKF